MAATKPIETSGKGKRTRASVAKRTDQSTWRTKIQNSRLKFTDKQKQRYLAALRKTGLMGRSAEVCDVSPGTVVNHREADPDFDEAVEKALETFRDIVADAVHARGVKGWEEPIFHKGMRVLEPVLDKDGAQVLTEDGKEVFRYASIRKFSDNLLILDAKRVDPTYRDKAAIDINAGGGGVLVVGPGMTPEEAIAEGEAANIEADKRHAEREAEKEAKG